MIDLQKSHFEVWANGVTWIRDAAAFLAIAKGEVRFPDDENVKYPLHIRRGTYGNCTLMWSTSIAVGIRRQFFPQFGTSNLSYPCADTKSIVDPLVRDGVLIMTHPANYPGEQDLYWADDAWYLQNKHHPRFIDQVYFP